MTTSGVPYFCIPPLLPGEGEHKGVDLVWQQVDGRATLDVADEEGDTPLDGATLSPYSYTRENPNRRG